VSEQQKPWAFIAHKDGYWAGVGSATMPKRDLRKFIGDFVKRLNIESAAPYTAFMHVIDRDARDAMAAVRLVLAQPSISSQLVDNLNASIHLRALLTDLFLIDEVFKSHRRS